MARIKGIGDLQWDIEFYRRWKEAGFNTMLKEMVKHCLNLILMLDKDPIIPCPQMRETCVYDNGKFISAGNLQDESLKENVLLLPIKIREFIKGISKNKSFYSVTYDWYGKRKVEINIETSETIRRPDIFLQSLIRKTYKFGKLENAKNVFEAWLGNSESITEPNKEICEQMSYYREFHFNYMPIPGRLFLPFFKKYLEDEYKSCRGCACFDECSDQQEIECHKHNDHEMKIIMDKYEKYLGTTMI